MEVPGIATRVLKASVKRFYVCILPTSVFTRHPPVGGIETGYPLSDFIRPSKGVKGRTILHSTSFCSRRQDQKTARYLRTGLNSGILNAIGLAMPVPILLRRASTVAGMFLSAFVFCQHF